MSESEIRSRRRGIRGSRRKLVKALTEAGLKTQAALAERMADLEGLDAAPKDVVNRVFRGLAVDPQTLERVARALNTQAHQLYLTADEVQAEEVDTAAPADAAASDAAAPADDEAPSLPPARRRARWLALVAGLAALAVAAALFMSRTAGPRQEAAVSSAGAQASRFGRHRIVVLPVRGDEGGEFAVAIRDGLEKSLGVASPAAALIAGSPDPREIARQLRAEAVLDGELVTVGRFSGVRLYMYVPSRGHREQIWAESFPHGAEEAVRAGVSERVIAAVHRAMGLPAAGGGNPPHFPLAPVQDDYLQGRRYLDSAPSELNLRRAQSSFEAATRQDPNYAEAYAALCETILDYIWVGDETRNLYNAERACSRAVQLTPDSPTALGAHAYFLSKTGRAQEALERYRALAQTYPDDLDVAFGLAGIEFALYRQEGGDALRESMLRNARHAADLDPSFWKTRMWLGIFEFQTGSIERALQELRSAADLEINEYTVTNLGTVYMCHSQFDQARELYERAAALAPGSYAGDEFLGALHFYMRDFARSVEYREKALKAASAGGEAEIHQMWGDLGDSRRRAGDAAGALEAYTKALTILERDFMNGNGTVADSVWRAYYYATLLGLDAARVPPAVERVLERDLEQASGKPMEPSGLLRLAQAWVLRNDHLKARAALAEATRLCSHYARNPDLDVLAAAAPRKQPSIGAARTPVPQS